MEENGLRIHNITADDDGVYTCHAKVESEGWYDERQIIVEVQSKSEYTMTFSCGLF